MPSALTPVTQDYYLQGARGREIARTVIQYGEDRLAITVNGTKVEVPIDALKDMHELEGRWKLVAAIHKGASFKMCYSSPAIKKTPASDDVVFVTPVRLAWAETKLAKGKTWVLYATIGEDPKEHEYLAANIRAVWDQVVIVKPAPVVEEVAV